MRLPRATAAPQPAWHLYVVADPDVERLESALAAAGIGHKAYYRTPVHRQAAMREWGAGVELPATDEAARTHLAIPMSPVLTREQVDEVVAAVRRPVGRRASELRRAANSRESLNRDHVNASLDPSLGRSTCRARPHAPALQQVLVATSRTTAPARPSRPRAPARRA